MPPVKVYKNKSSSTKMNVNCFLRISQRMERSLHSNFQFNFDFNNSTIGSALISRLDYLNDKGERGAVVKTVYHDISTSNGQCDDEHFSFRRKPTQGMTSYAHCCMT